MFNDVPDTCLPSRVNTCILLGRAAEALIFDIEGEKEFPLDKTEDDVISLKDDAIVK